MEYAGYIEQYSDKIRYMHMPMLAQLQTGTLIAAWQASPIVLEDLQVPTQAQSNAATRFAGLMDQAPLFLDSQERDMLAVEGMDQQHIRMSYAKDREGKVWSSSRRIQIPQQG